MSSLVIVAIPAQDDFVWQVSSEKIPHLTLLYLGDIENVDGDAYENMTTFVEHAATLLNPFYMDVDYRGTLGADDADVVFFEKGWDYKAICQFRDQLLGNNAIKAAYHAVPPEQQHNEWLPHLTLGYPATPAKDPGRERSVFSVRFDRIAIWAGDFDGPEFRLKRDDSNAMDSSPYVSMTMADAKELLHYGTKGMKWGVVKSRGGGSEPSTHTKDRATQPTPGGAKGQVQKFKDKRDKSLGDPTPVVAKAVTSKKTGKALVETAGGARQVAHPDAIKAKTASQQLHTSGINSLSNKDLKALAERIDLEQRVARLDPPKVSRGRAFINKLMADPKAREAYSANLEVGSKAVKGVYKYRKTKKAAKGTAVVATKLLTAGTV